MSSVNNKFLYQIVDSGYFFTITIKKFSLISSNNATTITLEYILENRYKDTFMVPIDISYALTLNCSHVSNFDEDTCEQTWSKRVFNLTTKQPMYGQANDHYVRFDPNDIKSFLVEFQPVDISVAMIDIELLLLPEKAEYGKYRLRYNANQDAITGCYCIRSIPIAHIYPPQ